MKIGIDARLYSQSGVGRYIRNLITQLQQIDKENEQSSFATQNEYYIFLMADEYDRLDYHTNFKKIFANYKWYGVSEQINFPRLLKQYNLDLIHFPHFNVPYIYSGKYIVTIHDLIHQHFQMKRATTLNPFFYKLKQLGYNKVFSNAINKSQKILVPSDFVKNQLIDEWKVKQEKILVTPEAVDDKILTIAKKMSKQKIDKVLKKFNIQPPFTAKQEPSGFIFYIGNAHPHKNVEGLIEAFLILRKKYQYLKLVLAGSSHYFWDRIKSTYDQESIIYTGYIEDSELVAFYKSAKAFVIPSFEEGFGIPILEAFACQCPVVSSNKGSLPEIGGDACLYFDPNNLDEMVEKIAEVLNSEKKREDFIKKGEERYKLFSWKKLTEETLKIYKSV